MAGNQYLPAHNSTALIGSGTYTTAPPPDRQVQTMDVALDDLQGLLALLANTHSRVRATTDRLIGGEPSPISKAEGAPTATVLPVTIRLSQALRDAHAIAEAIRHEVERLETL